ncbi:SAM-dependent methyltransferase [Winogradskya humida]|uniref:S-adenosyl methyltransferase n=1 Tax=Winogradskya humida TaxID=113566 RepID=A0ABQ4A4P7_9ACTN|nr:SAM-dependent methyltransferase [Actinoplanes humidus]GIE25821.1 hypothetical protein Ahu01nite_089230 [Actinoplanes humidus]
MDETWARAHQIDTSTAHPARRYNYLLGGKDYFPVDRESGEEFERVSGSAKLTARENRAFLQRAVACLATEGIDQFLDIGTGLPTADNTHEVAQRINPRSRVAYVDNDPLVLTHARAMLTSTPEGHCPAVRQLPGRLAHDDRRQFTGAGSGVPGPGSSREN